MAPLLERDAQGRVQTRILHSFGRTDQLDHEQIRRLVDQLGRYLDPAAAPGTSGVEVSRSWSFGGTHLLDALWRELALDRFFSQALADRAFAQPVERAIFALVCHRALAPASKLACSRWAGARAWIPGLERGGEELDIQHLYRAMDFLHAAMPDLQEHLYFQVSDLLNADVSVLFYDTTTVSFYLDCADPEGGLRRYGHSKKKRPDLSQIVVALAINRDGIPVRHGVIPGNRSDVTTVEEVTRDLLGLRPAPLPLRRRPRHGQPGTSTSSNRAVWATSSAAGFAPTRRSPHACSPCAAATARCARGWR